MNRKFLSKRSNLTRNIAALLFGSGLLVAPAQAQQYWNTNGTLATISDANWGTVSTGPFISAFTANGNIVFGANSLITGATVDVGNITVDNGFTVTFTAGGTLGTGGNVRTLDIGTGSTLDLAGQALSTAAGTGFIKNGTGTLISSNGNAYAGGFTLNAGTVAVGGVNAMGDGGALTINGGTIRSNSTTARNLSDKYDLGITIGGNFTLGDAVNTGALTFNNTMALGAANRTITTNSNATFAGAISGAAGIGLTKEGTGSLTLSGANTFTGAINVNAGSLIIGGATYPALGGNNPGTNGPSSITVASGATLNFTQAGTGATTANYFQPLTINGGSLITSGGSGTNTLALNLNGGLTLGGNTSTTINGNSTLIIPGTTTVSLGSNTLTIQTDGSLAGNNIGAPISGSGGSLIKNGANALTLSGNNTYSGATTVNAGTLNLDYNTQNNSKLSDTAALTLAGITTVALTGATGNHTEAVASTTLADSANLTVNRSGGNTAVLQLGNITNNANARINFGAASIATTNNTNNSLGILGTWATIAGNDWAVNSTNGPNGLITGATYTDVTRLSSGTKTIATAAAHIRIIEGTGTTGDITMAAPGTTSIQTLVNTATVGTVDIGSGNTLQTGAILQGTGAGVLTVGVPATPGTLTAYSAGGDLAVVANAAMTINSVISNNTSASTLTKSGSNTLTLTGNNTYTGATVVNAGTLSIANNNSLGTTDGATTINGGNGTTGVALDLTSATSGLTIAENINLLGNLVGRATLTNNGAFNHTLTGAINVSSDTNLSQITSSNNSGSITVSGDITGTLANNAVFFLRGASTSATNRVIGSVNLTGGNLAKTDAGTWLVGAPGKSYSWVNTALALGTLRMGTANVLPSTSELIMGQSGAATPTLDLNGFDQTIAGIVYSTSGSTGTRTITNTAGGGAAVLTVNNATNYSPTGGSAVNSVVLTGNLSLVKQGAGSLTLSGTNTYTGATNISGGNLIIGTTGVIANTATNTITIGNTGTLTMSRTDTWGNSASGNPLLPIVINAGGTMTTGGNFFNTLGALTLNGGTLTSTGGANANFGSWALRGNVTVGGSTASTISQSGTNANINLGANTVTGTTFNVADVTSDSNVDLTVSAVLQNGSNASNVAQASSLTKTGAGTMALSGANTYTGVTTVSAGTLVINGDQSAATGMVTVNGGTLGGNGIIGGAVTVNTAALAPGNSAGTLTINNALALTSSSILNWELNASDQTAGGGINDLVTGVTNLTLDGTLNVSSSALSAGTWRLFNYSGVLTDSTLDLGAINLAPLHTALIDTTTTAGQVNLVVQAIPEPSTLVLGGLALLGFAGVGLRRRRLAKESA